MKRSWILIFLLLLSSIPAYAQSDWRVFGGFSFDRVGFLPADFSYEQSGLGLENEYMYGWTASVTQYTSLKWLGTTVEVGGQYRSPALTFPADYFGEGVPETDVEIDHAVHASTYSVMVGPSFAYRGNSDVEPFAHVLLGGVYGRADLSSMGESLFGSSMTASDWVFGYAIGGGADFKISKHVALRGQVDWVRSMFRDGIDDRQNNLKISGGLVLHLSE